MTLTNGKMRDNAPQQAFSFVQAGFWMSFCVSVSFAAVYLQALGYSNSTLGIIAAFGNIMGAAVSLAMSAWIDSKEQITAGRLIPWFLAFQAASAAVLLVTGTRSAAVSVAFVCYIGFCTAVNALNLKLYADADHAGFVINYGFTRGVGSLAYVLISVLTGLMIEKLSHRFLPVLGLILCAFQFAEFIRFKHFASEGKKAESFGENNSTLPAFLKNNPRYTVFLTGAALLFFGHSIACSFLINLTRQVGGTAADMGLINAFKGIVEIPVMFLYMNFFKDGRHVTALRISAVSFVLKTLAFILARNTWQLTAAFIFQAPSYALYMSAAVAYAKETISFKDSAKAQSLAFTTTTFGGMLASFIGGRLYDSMSVTNTLWIALAAGAAGVFIVFLGTKKSEHSSAENSQ